MLTHCHRGICDTLPLKPACGLWFHCQKWQTAALFWKFLINLNCMYNTLFVTNPIYMIHHNLSVLYISGFNCVFVLWVIDICCTDCVAIFSVVLLYYFASVLQMSKAVVNWELFCLMWDIG
jgi:hypothetical protein